MAAASAALLTLNNLKLEENLEVLEKTWKRTWKRLNKNFFKELGKELGKELLELGNNFI